MTAPKQPVTIDGIEFDALIEESVSYDADVPQYPTEKGFNVSDNITLQPETISMKLFVTDTPVTWASRHGVTPGRTETVISKLKELYFSKKVVSVVTSSQVYESMAITSISLEKNSDYGNAREIPISLQKIVVTESTTVTIPDSYGKSGTTAVPNGTANTVSKRQSYSGGSGSGSYRTSARSSSGSSGGRYSSEGTSGGGTSKSSGKSSSSGKSGSILYNAASSFGLI